jgi:hypothetical protein
LGAHCIERHVVTTENCALAYERLYDQERYENGADAYSGSFAVTRGVLQIATSPVSVYEARTIASTLFGEGELPTHLRSKLTSTTRPAKWGSALALPVLDDSCYKKSRTKLTITHTETGRLGTNTVRELVAAKIDLTDGMFIHSATVISDEAELKITTAKSRGPKRTVYVLRDGERLLSPTEYTSEAEAVAAGQQRLATLIERGQGLHGVTFHVEGIVRRERPYLTELSISAKKRKTVVDVELHSVKPGASTLGGWYFFAVAAS